jgi:hypothetical protein
LALDRSLERVPVCCGRKGVPPERLLSERKISHHWEESSKTSNAERIQTRGKTWRAPAGHAEQEDGPRERSLRCCDFQPGPVAAGFFVGSHEKFVDVARLAGFGRGGAASSLLATQNEPFSFVVLSGRSRISDSGLRRLCAKSGSRRNQITEIDSTAYVKGGGMIKSLSTSN